MKSRLTAALLTALLASGAAGAADYALVMPTGAVVNCSDVGKVRFKDMPRLYGMNSFSKEYEQYVRFHTYAPHDCRNAAGRDTIAAKAAPHPWKLVAQDVGTPSR